MLSVILLTLAATPAVDRALAWLEREVPAWRRDNGCFSCHNDGDGARALYAAGRFAAVRATTAWLAKPSEWETNRGNPAASDKRLARLQFAQALLAAIEVGALQNTGALAEAARLLLKDRAADGSWPIEDEANLGSPATYGRTLATVVARRILTAAKIPSPETDRWLEKAKPRATVDAAALVIAGFTQHEAQVLKARSSDGGFGPHPGDPPEVFDTALAIIALAKNQPEATNTARRWLEKQQQPDGSWPETTRPSGSQSYAQRVSTTAWALLALL